MQSNRALKIFAIYISNSFAFRDDNVFKLADCEFVQVRRFLLDEEVKQEM